MGLQKQHVTHIWGTLYIHIWMESSDWNRKGILKADGVAAKIKNINIKKQNISMSVNHFC